MWKLRPSLDTGKLELLLPSATLDLGSRENLEVFLAKARMDPNAPRLSVSAKQELQKTPGYSPKLEQLEALAEYLKVWSPLNASQEEDMRAVIADASLACLEVVSVRPSGAQRRWQNSTAVITVTKANTVACYNPSYRAGPSTVVSEGDVPHLGEFAYFEVLILSCGEGLGVGMVDKTQFHPSFQMPGWANNSFGYHSDDGNFYFGGMNRSFGPTFSAGDVVGCGVDEIKGDLFFTLNGRFLGVAISGVNSYLMRPAVGMCSFGEKVFANFGELPFLWDFTFEPSDFQAAPRVQDVSVSSADSKPVLVKVDQDNFAGGLWASEFAILYSRLCFVDPPVHSALEQTSGMFQSWKK